MATSSEVKAALDDIAQSIRTERQALKNAKARIATGKNNLISLPTIFADAIATITGFAPIGAMETLAKDEFLKLKHEFEILRDDAALAVTDLANRTEF